MCNKTSNSNPNALELSLGFIIQLTGKRERFPCGITAFETEEKHQLQANLLGDRSPTSTDPVAIEYSKAEKTKTDEPAEFLLCYSANQLVKKKIKIPLGSTNVLSLNENNKIENPTLGNTKQQE